MSRGRPKLGPAPTLIVATGKENPRKTKWHSTTTTRGNSGENPAAESGQLLCPPCQLMNGTVLPHSSFDISYLVVMISWEMICIDKLFIFIQKNTVVLAVIIQAIEYAMLPLHLSRFRSYTAVHNNDCRNFTTQNIYIFFKSSAVAGFSF